MGFEPMVNQRLLPPTFPRYTRIKPRVEALQYFDELVSRLRHAWKITSCTNFHTALVRYNIITRLFYLYMYSIGLFCVYFEVCVKINIIVSQNIFKKLIKQKVCFKLIF